MDRFKELTGGDTISIEFKNCEPFDYVFKGLMLFGMNSLPRFGGDKGVHVYNRMLIIKCSNVISKNQQDPHLIEKLYAEREGIIQNCVVALKDVIQNNYQFHIPPECEVNLDEYKTENSSVVEFWNECIEPCDVNESHINKSSQVYRCYKIWALENGMRYTADSKEFANEISQYLNLKWKWEIISKLRDGNYLSNFKLNEQGRELAASNY
jgi:phage/plasmid-associated DNA primase